MKTPAFSAGSLLAAALFASMMSVAMPARALEKVAPRLLLNIMVDGLDAETLDQLETRLSNEGFRFLRDKGLRIDNLDYGTGLDVSAATAMLMTGSAPAVNGVASATVYDPATRLVTPVYNDPQVLGNFTSRTFSPNALRVSTLADEAVIASGGVNINYAVAPQPGQAIALAGHNGTAIWLDPEKGSWASSTYYRELPATVTNRNRLKPLATRMDTMSWTPMLPPDQYPGLPDHLRRYPFRYVFPRNVSTAERVERFSATPLLNTEVTDLAIDLIKGLHIGGRPAEQGGTDILSVAYSLQPTTLTKSAEARPELLDAYLRLDRDIARLLTQAGGQAGGNNNIAVLLCAMPPSSSSRRDDEKWRIPYGEFSTRKAASLLNMYLIALYGNGDWVNGYHNGLFYLNEATIKNLGQQPDEVRRQAAAFLVKMTGVDAAYTIEDIIEGRAGDNSVALRRNIPLENTGDILLRIAPGFEIIDDFGTGTASGDSQSLVQRFVATTAPAFIYAPAMVESRVLSSPVDARAIAPTVSRVLRIRSPNAASTPPLPLTAAAR